MLAKIIEVSTGRNFILLKLLHQEGGAGERTARVLAKNAFQRLAPKNFPDKRIDDWTLTSVSDVEPPENASLLLKVFKYSF